MNDCTTCHWRICDLAHWMGLLKTWEDYRNSRMSASEIRRILDDHNEPVWERAWFPKSQSQYCRPQILWVLKKGGWPVQETGYYDTHENVQTSTKQSAKFETETIELAEIKARLGIFDGEVNSETRALSAWPDGITLLEEMENGAVEPRTTAAWRALGYAGCGPERRRETYAHWKDRKYGKKGIIIPVKK